MIRPNITERVRPSADAPPEARDAGKLPGDHIGRPPRDHAGPPRIAPHARRARPQRGHTSNRSVAPVSARATSHALLARTACAVCVGLLVILVGGIEYDAAARIEVTGSLDAARTALLDYVWHHATAPHGAPTWHVEPSTDRSTLTLHLKGPDATETEHRLHRLMTGFKVHLATMADDAERRENEVAEVLDAFLAEFIAAAQLAEASARSAEADIPAQSPLEALRELTTRIRDHVDALDSLRTAESGVQTDLERLQRPLNVSELITPQMTESACHARADLQQDLAQLSLQLTIGEALLLDVWQETSPRLDELVAAGSRLLRATYNRPGRAADPDYLDQLGALQKRLGHYQQRLVALAEKWTRAFTSLKTEPVDPMQPRLLTTHHRLKDLLGDFCHHAGNLLDAMRDDVVALGDRSDPSQQRLTSDIKRSFQRLESKHRRFEFSASSIEPRNNFRLDAALDSAAGLHRRVKQTTAQIDAQLKADALARAKTERIAANSNATRKRESLRRNIDATVDSIIGLYGQYVAAVPQAESYLRPVISSEAARRQLVDARQCLQRCRSLADRLRHLHHAGVTPSSVRLMQTSVSIAPDSITSRMLLAVLAAAVTLAGTGYLTRWRKTAA